MSDRLLIISGDNHAGAQLSEYAPYIEAMYRPALKDLEEEEAEFFAATGALSKFSSEVLEVIDDRQAIRTGGVSGAWDVARRLKEMDAEGVAAEIVHAGHQAATMPFFSQVNKPHPVEYRAAGARAYHRWFADCIAEGQGRIHGVADPGPCHDVFETVRELHWLADNGFVSVGVPGIVKDDNLPSLMSGYFEPFWTACEERGLVLSVHAGWGAEQGMFFKYSKMRAEMGMMQDAQDSEAFAKALRESRESPLFLNLAPRRVFWQLAMAGVFDRHPRLKFCFTEVRADWIPETMAWLDRRFDRTGVRARLRPSEYFKRQGYACPSSPRPTEIALRDRIGLERFMFGVDYPHPEGTWPNTLPWLRSIFADIPEHDARRILGQNAVDCYGLDAAKLSTIAEKIGPKPTEVLSFTGQIDRGVLDHFDVRAGFARPPEMIDELALERAFQDDLRVAAA
ncbi:MAG TPA: amidohydrolase family protein [Caulobacteraceae bacterium]|jgi:predicted TIM-barrel fold metal-dependent hydrolase